MLKPHTFHIPVLGVGFSIDTPIKVAPYGIDSVLSLGDDILIEKMRKMYCQRNNLPYQPIDEKSIDYRANRITAYLNLINDLVNQKFEEIKNNPLGNTDGILKYIQMLPEHSILKNEFKQLVTGNSRQTEIKSWVEKNFTIGSIDVNIMTKIDGENFHNNIKLSTEYNDAHAALRGYANSNLQSGIVFSAGMNPRLYSYMENFTDFYPDSNGFLKKKIVLKVSDYRSAFIQGKYLAKKGLWVSEYRIESGLNCGGHAFATNGTLLGPILKEFRDKKNELTLTMHDLYIQSLQSKGINIPNHILPIRIAAQGGVGTNQEHQFLIDHYKVDSVGWGTPFLLVPEIINIDPYTLNQLSEAKESDLYISEISPLGIPFNTMKESTKGIEKRHLAGSGKPGSPCVRDYLSFNTEYNEKGLCPASRKYQHQKIKELQSKNLPEQEYNEIYNAIVDKECLCTGLGVTALIVNKIDNSLEGNTVSVCPGPNLAYFSDVMSLEQIINHIYGRTNVIKRKDRPNMFVKELELNISYLKKKLEKLQHESSESIGQNMEEFKQNVTEGIKYYRQLFSELNRSSKGIYSSLLNDLTNIETKFKSYLQQISVAIT